MRIRVMMLGSSLLLAACQTTQTVENPMQMAVSFNWNDTKSCSSTSPEINIENVPGNTRFVDIRLIDLDAPAFNHGGSVVGYDGSGLIKKGALSNYTGPCPPSGTSHRYQFTVRALNADKTLILGTGMSTATFPSTR
jgi:phosphatidylethanolamine-binding protein (PEBP) family uncharacterized protein